MASSSTTTTTIPPFPDNIPVAPLVTISLRRLLESPANINNAEHQKLFDASKNLGFFYLDMRDTPVGEALLTEADTLFDLAMEFFNLPLEEKRKYDFAVKKIYFGYKGEGKEVINKTGDLNRDQQYNVCMFFNFLLPYFPLSSLFSPLGKGTHPDDRQAYL